MARTAGLQRLQVALVHPDRVQHALGVERHRLEAVRDQLPIAVHGERRREAAPAVVRAQHADLAGVGARQRLCVGDDRLARGAESDLGPVLALRGDHVLADVQQPRCSPDEPGIRAVLHEQAARRVQTHHPQHAIGRKGSPKSQRRWCPALRCCGSMGGMLRPRRRYAGPDQQGHDAAQVPRVPRVPGQTPPYLRARPARHHRASRPAYSARGRAGEYTGVLDETEALSAWRLSLRFISRANKAS